MACGPCAARRAKLAEQLKTGQVVEAAQTAIVGIGMMAGILKKDEKYDNETAPRA